MVDLSRSLGVPGGRATKVWELSAKKVMLAGAKLRRWAEIVEAGTGTPGTSSQGTSPRDSGRDAGSNAGSSPGGRDGAGGRRAPRDPAAQWPGGGGGGGGGGLLGVPLAAPAFSGAEDCLPNSTDGWASMWGNDIFAGLDNSNLWFEGVQDWTPPFHQSEMPR